MKQATTGQTIYRVRYDNRDYYFGSITAIYDVFTPERLHVRRERLWAYGITEEHPYKNIVCEIHRGTLHRHTTNRRKPQ